MVRTRHPFWAGFEAVKHPKDPTKIVAKCRKCKHIETNTQSKRLQNHKCENHGYKPNQVLLSSQDITKSANDPIDLDEFSQNSTNSEGSSIVSRENLKSQSCSQPKRIRLTEFIDIVPLEDQNEIAQTLSMFLFSEGISPNAIKNKYFQQFCKKLKPAFRIPESDRVKTDILDSIYCQILETSKSKSLQEGILIMNHDSNKVSKLTSYHTFLVKSANFP